MPNKPKFTADHVGNALRLSDGLIAVAAGKLGCTRQTVQLYIRRHPSLQAVVEECRETLVDIGEQKLHEKVRAGEWDAVKYLLSTQGKARGYSQRQEVTGADGKDLLGQHFEEMDDKQLRKLATSVANATLSLANSEGLESDSGDGSKGESPDS